MILNITFFVDLFIILVSRSNVPVNERGAVEQSKDIILLNLVFSKMKNFRNNRMEMKFGGSTVMQGDIIL